MSVVDRRGRVGTGEEDRLRKPNIPLDFVFSFSPSLSPIVRERGRSLIVVGVVGVVVGVLGGEGRKVEEACPFETDGGGTSGVDAESLTSWLKSNVRTSGLDLRYRPVVERVDLAFSLPSSAVGRVPRSVARSVVSVVEDLLEEERVMEEVAFRRANF